MSVVLKRRDGVGGGHGDIERETEDGYRVKVARIRVHQGSRRDSWIRVGYEVWRPWEYRDGAGTKQDPLLLTQVPGSEDCRTLSEARAFIAADRIALGL